MIKQLFHSRRYAPRCLTTISYPTRSRGIIVNYMILIHKNNQQIAVFISRWLHLFFRIFYSLFCFILWSVPVSLSLSILSSILSAWNKDANFFFSFLVYPSHSAIKKYKRQLVDQIKGLETDLEKTASTVREMEVGIYGNPTIRSPCPFLSITQGSTPWLWLQMDNWLPPVSCFFYRILLYICF